VRINGPRDLAHAFPSWLALNMFAHIEPVRDSPVSFVGRS
jgi:hypothetical protein